MFPVPSLLISIVSSKPELAPLKYPGYAELTSDLLTPVLIVATWELSTKTLISVIPKACKAQPLILNLPLVITSEFDGDSKLLFAGKYSEFVASQYNLNSSTP